MTHTTTREPLSHVDAAWLRMDSPENPMVITAALMFDRTLPFSAVESVLEERLAPHPRFRQRAVESKTPLTPAYWENDPLFDMRSHLHHMRLPAPADQDAFERLLSDLMSTPLPRDRPLWQAYLVDDAPGGTALIVRLHHSIGDGVALVRLLLSLCDEAGGASRKPKSVGLSPAEKGHTLLDRGKHAAEQAATLGKLLLLPEDPPSPLKAKLGARKRCAYTKPIELDEVKRIAAVHNATTNDVLQACVAGALRRYLLSREALPMEEIKALVPVFLKAQDGLGLGNHFGLVFLALPIRYADILDRLRETKRRMDELKVSDDATVAFAVLDAMGTASSTLEHIAMEIFTRKASLLTTNVPGPASKVLLSGYELSSMLVWAPVSGYVGLGVTLLSYAGKVRVGISADEHVMPDPGALKSAFEADFEELSRCSR